MKPLPAVICSVLAILLCHSSQLNAQFLELNSVRVELAGNGGEPDFPSLEKFVRHSAEPLRIGRFEGASESLNEVNSGDFSISFTFEAWQNPRHHVTLGVHKMTLTANLYSKTVAPADTTTINISAYNEYFGVDTGYLFHLNPGSRFTFYAGGSLLIGIPIAATISEEYVSPAETETRTFFAGKNLMYGLVIPIGVEIRILQKFKFRTGLTGGFRAISIDGIQFATAMPGISVGLEFGL